MSKRPVVLVVMDGIGINEEEGNAVKAANTPTLDMLMVAVHLPDKRTVRLLACPL